MTRDDIIAMAREAGEAEGLESMPFHTVLERFAALVAQRERDELVVMFLEAHEGVNEAHNYWAVAANKIRARGETK